MSIAYKKREWAIGKGVPIGKKYFNKKTRLIYRGPKGGTFYIESENVITSRTKSKLKKYCRIYVDLGDEKLPVPKCKWSEGMKKHLEEQKGKSFPTPFEQCSHIDYRDTGSGLNLQTHVRDFEISCYDCGAIWDVYLQGGKKKARIKFREIRKSLPSERITGTFMGCRSSSDDYDEIHIQTQDPIIVKHPIAMPPAVMVFQHHKLKRGDTITFTLDEEDWTNLESLEVLERGPNEKPEQKMRLLRSRRRRNIKRAAIYDETLGWCKDEYGIKHRRVRWHPVKKGTKGGIWIPGPGFMTRRYITPEKFNELKISGTIITERPPGL